MIKNLIKYIFELMNFYSPPLVDPSVIGDVDQMNFHRDNGRMHHQECLYLAARHQLVVHVPDGDRWTYKARPRQICANLTLLLGASR